MARASRFLAWLCLLIAVLAAVTDVTRTYAAHRVVVSSLLDHWGSLAPHGLAVAQAAVRRIPLLWDFLVRPALSVPAWALFGLLGLLFAFLGRRRHKVNIFAN